MFPQSGMIYTYKEITSLTLSDSPCLLFYHQDTQYVIQDSHMDQESMLNVFSESRWRYVYTTHEEIPIFDSVDDIQHLVDIQEYWVTPKGYPRS